MKKIFKIVAFVLLIALAVLCLVKMIQYIAYGYNTIYSYFYILLKSKFSDPQHQTHAFSYLGIIVTCFINFVIYIVGAINLLNPSFLARKIQALIDNTSATLADKKSRNKQRKIEKMKSKIEKMESDE